MFGDCYFGPKSSGVSVNEDRPVLAGGWLNQVWTCHYSRQIIPELFIGGLNLPVRG